MSAMAHDVQQELSELEVEEAKILRELREMDEKAHLAELAARGKIDAARADPRNALNSALLECEREVREAKGYISSPGPPLTIARCKRGEQVPKHATFLSRPKGTGVDFTVPVTLKDYADAVKSPIFLNNIRDKCRSGAYNTADDYLADMRLLEKNTALFNKRSDLQWVVQHARLLLEAAEEAVSLRRAVINEAEDGLRRMGGGSRQLVGKRKRGGSSAAAGGSQHATDASMEAVRALPLGTIVQIFWDSDRKWHSAKVVKRGPASQVFVEYDAVDAEWLDLTHEVKWRLPPASATQSAPTRSKRLSESAAAKRRRPASSTPPAYAGPPPPAPQAARAEKVQGVDNEILATMQEEIKDGIATAKDAMMESVRDSFLKVERSLNRNDALHRVLLAVQDAQTSIEERMDKLEDGIRKNNEQLQRLFSAMGVSLTDGMATIPSQSAAAVPNDVHAVTSTPHKSLSAGNAFAPEKESDEGRKQLAQNGNASEMENENKNDGVGDDKDIGDATLQQEKTPEKEKQGNAENVAEEEKGVSRETNEKTEKGSDGGNEGNAGETAEEPEVTVVEVRENDRVNPVFSAGSGKTSPSEKMDVIVIDEDTDGGKEQATASGDGDVVGETATAAASVAAAVTPTLPNAPDPNVTPATPTQSGKPGSFVRFSRKLHSSKTSPAQTLRRELSNAVSGGSAGSNKVVPENERKPDSTPEREKEVKKKNEDADDEDDDDQDDSSSSGSDSEDEENSPTSKRENGKQKPHPGDLDRMDISPRMNKATEA